MTRETRIVGLRRHSMLGTAWTALLITLSGCGDSSDQHVGGATGTAGQAAPGIGTSTAGSTSAGNTAAGSSPVTSGAAGMAGVAMGAPGAAGSNVPRAGQSAAAGMMAAVAGAGPGATTAGAGAAGSGPVAGSPGAGGASGAASAAGAGGGMGAMHADLGKGNGSDVITIGDSWMNLITTGIEPSLDKASGQRYRHYAVPGTLLLNGQIPNQFKQAVAENKDVKTVVMTAGGNDILTSPCSGEACNSIVDDVVVGMTKMFTDMAAAGVQDVVVISYTYPADASKKVALDHSLAVYPDACKTDSMPRCRWINSTKLNLTLQDGIHPNAAGCDTIGKAVWDLMVAEGIRR